MAIDSPADRASDELRTELIAGEPRNSEYADDAQQWVAVYTELVSFTSRVLARQGAAASEESDGGLLPADEQRLRDHLQRLISRLHFWRRRMSELAGIEIDAQQRTLTYQGNTVGLTHREAQLLKFLSDHPRRAFTASQLIQQAWHAPELSEEELRTYIVRLRRWIANLALPCAIINEPRHGYTFRFTG